MEIHFTTFLLFSSFIFILVIKLWKSQKSPPKHQNLPPSPSKLPIIGHLHHLTGGLPHRALRKLGPVSHLQLGQVSAVVISSRQAAKEILKDHDPACADRPDSIGTRIMLYDHTDIAFSPYNEYWRQMRKIATVELLSAKNVKSFGSIRLDEVNRLVNSLRSLPPGDKVNLSDKISAFTSSITCRAAFGEEMRDRDTFMSLMKETLTMANGVEIADLFPSYKLLHLLSWSRYKLLGMRRKLDSILDVFIENHRIKKQNSEGEDILDVLVRMQRNRELKIPITNDNIKAVVFDMFTAGTDTSSATIDWAMAELMRSPRAMGKAQAEIREAFKGKMTNDDVHDLKYLKLVIKETLRMHPPIALIGRACREECKVGGFTIPVKSKIWVNIWAMGRDPEYWDKPERFNPERFEGNPVDFFGNNFEYIPFGAGRRICPGMNFGLANVELPLAHLLYHFDWKMPKGMMRPDEIDMAEAEGMAVSRKNGLFLIPKAFYGSSSN